MKKLTLLIPTAVLLLSPWMHKLIYKNFLMAWPDLDSVGAHWLGIFGALIAFVVTCFINSDLGR